ncbi:MAG TPA: formylglycine-generating enzyme family protein [Phycisphaerae bacterium]|nr:formylglycine-generating enzyme family protein [Phycisphaerae bacterium]HRR87323.1 formylglycine-generating enzyme family protein [Phycisphaerae bacterium]
MSDNRFRFAGAVLAVVLLLAGGVGCCLDKQARITVASATDVTAGTADRGAPLPAGVSLPPGFYPLSGQYDLENPDDHYGGWPRYIMCVADGMVMAYVPAQEFMMGGGTDLDEVPARAVRVNHFYVDIHEVTNCQFGRYSRQGPYRQFYMPGVNDHHPVRNVSWVEAHGYAAWAGKSLPTEAQWEAAARGSDRRIYPWGNEEQSDVTRYLCNASTGRDYYDGYQGPAPVMSYSAGISPFGAFNMAGNVWEWCADWYDPGRYAYPSEEDPPSALERGALPFGDRNYPSPKHKDIREARVGPPVGLERVIRGGSFMDPIQQCRVDTRASLPPAARRNNVGFRCVLMLPPTEDNDLALASR